MAISLGDAANIIRRIEVIRIYKLVVVVGNVPDMDTPRYGNSPYNDIEKSILTIHRTIVIC